MIVKVRSGLFTLLPLFLELGAAVTGIYLLYLLLGDTASLIAVIPFSVPAFFLIAAQKEMNTNEQEFTLQLNEEKNMDCMVIFYPINYLSQDAEKIFVILIPEQRVEITV